MTYLVLAVIFLHLCVLTITMRAHVNVDSDKGRITVVFKLFFVPVFKKSVNIEAGARDGEKIEDNERAESDDGARSTRGFKRALIEYAKNFAVVAAKRVRVRQMDLTAAIAVTATAVGMLKIAYSQACAFLNYIGDSDGIRPDYQSEYIFVDFSGIFSLCLADIIYAANAAAVKTVRRGDSKNRRKAYATNLVAERTAGPSD